MREGGDACDLDVVRALYEAFEAGDHRAIAACLSSDLRWRQAGFAVPAAGEQHVGSAALIARVIEPLERDWDGFTEEVDDIVGMGGQVVATGTYRGVYRLTGRRLEAEFCHLWWVREGRIHRFRQYTDTAAFQMAMAPPT